MYFNQLIDCVQTVSDSVLEFNFKIRERKENPLSLFLFAMESSEFKITDNPDKQQSVIWDVSMLNLRDSTKPLALNTLNSKVTP